MNNLVLMVDPNLEGVTVSRMWPEDPQMDFEDCVWAEKVKGTESSAMEAGLGRALPRSRQLMKIYYFFCYWHASATFGKASGKIGTKLILHIAVGVRVHASFQDHWRVNHISYAAA